MMTSSDGRLLRTESTPSVMKDPSMAASVPATDGGPRAAGNGIKSSQKTVYI